MLSNLFIIKFNLDFIKEHCNNWRGASFWTMQMRSIMVKQRFCFNNSSLWSFSYSKVKMLFFLSIIIYSLWSISNAHKLIGNWKWKENHFEAISAYPKGVVIETSHNSKMEIYPSRWDAPWKTCYLTYVITNSPLPIYFF